MDDCRSRTEYSEGWSGYLSVFAVYRKGWGASAPRIRSPKRAEADLKGASLLVPQVGTLGLVEVGSVVNAYTYTFRVHMIIGRLPSRENW